MRRPSRPLPTIGMPVIVVHLGAREDAIVEEVHDGGRTVVVDGERYELNRLTGHFVHADDPYYGRRLRFVR